LIIRKTVKIIATICHILRPKCTNFYSRLLSVRSFVRPSVRLCLDTVDESQRRPHGVTAAIVVDVVGAPRPCVSVCPSVSLSLTAVVRGLFRVVAKNEIRATMYDKRLMATESSLVGLDFELFY